MEREQGRLEEERLEDADTARLVARFQAGAADAYARLYQRYFDRVYAYMRVVLGSQHEAEDATQQVFLRIFESIASYEQREQPFRAWLFTIVRNHAIKHLRKHRRIELVSPDDIEAHPRRAADAEAQARSLRWIPDSDLVFLASRLPLAQRQVLLLRFMLDFSIKETAAVLGRTESNVGVLQHRAVAFLKERLTALGQDPKKVSREPVRRKGREASVLRARRFALQLEQRSTAAWGR